MRLKMTLVFISPNTRFKLCQMSLAGSATKPLHLIMEALKSLMATLLLLTTKLKWQLCHFSSFALFLFLFICWTLRDLLCLFLCWICEGWGTNEDSFSRMGVAGEYSLCSCSCSGVCSQFWFERSLILISFDLEMVSCCACWRSFFFQHDQFLWTREAAGFCCLPKSFFEKNFLVF